MTEPIAIVREGDGPELLLVHGGAGPETTWGALGPLAGRWTLLFAYRRGYPPSPPPTTRHQDFDDDAIDLAALLDRPRHIVAHSYGVLGALIAAGQHPAFVRSLTLIEPPLYYLAPDDPHVARLQALGDAVLREGLDADPVMLREFLTLAGAPDMHDGPLPADVARAVRRAHGSRLPNDARPPLDVLREHGVPALVASGAHNAALERICDALATELNAERVITPGAGHFVASAPAFAEQLERFLLSV
jgi:pimeloyl-ACP methyl ester carboxylesterase